MEFSRIMVYLVDSWVYHERFVSLMKYAGEVNKIEGQLEDFSHLGEVNI